MTNKQIVAELLERLPEDASLTEIARAIKFVDGVRKGLNQADRGEFLEAEQLFAELRQMRSH